MIKSYHKHSETLLEQLPKGVFITVKDRDGRVNTMTIAWGHLGVIWNKPIFIAYVRYSRFTYNLLTQADDYTINVPVSNDMKAALKIAGTESGRDVDKFKKANLTLKSGRRVKSPVIAECELHYECKLIYTQTQDLALIPDDIKAHHYKNHDTHIMFFGEIVDNYILGE